MGYLKSHLVLIITSLHFISKVLAETCTKREKYAFGLTITMVCPGPYDSKDKDRCCGSEKHRYCCNPAEFSSTLNTVGVIAGVLTSAIVIFIIIVIISCFCCSCCLLARRRSGYGARSTTGTTTVTYPAQAMVYQTQPVYPPQASYPPQTGYPNQTNYPNQTGYPLQTAYPQYPNSAYDNSHQEKPPMYTH